MKTACALMAVYNEEDIIVETVTKLIRDGVDVFILDNGSTDRSIELLAPFVGKGVVDIQSVRFQEGGREVFALLDILRLKQELSLRLGYDWYLQVDADEIRYSPWPEVSLREGLDRVDCSGYNLVNFKLYNFRLSHDLPASIDYERDMPNYSDGERFNQYQVKAWKAHPEIDILGNGGHIVRRPDPRIYPVRFIHKHYPVRSLEHGKRKILEERKQRFSQSEKQRGWHVQYDQLTHVKAEDIFWPLQKLASFDLRVECFALMQEGAAVACDLLGAVRDEDWDRNMELALFQRFSGSAFPVAHAARLLVVAKHLVNAVSRGQPPPVEASSTDIEFMQCAARMLACRRWLTGDASILDRVKSLQFRVV